ncbi:MAG: succinylglutamate desuccinylase/aspartoacylase family protein, partial [Deltaproteobacteria bacterium]|nr:succinylglutamate desuccinylase/aspartoacylase family protein [Deltaproteobacteria bacterium]
MRILIGTNFKDCFIISFSYLLRIVSFCLPLLLLFPVFCFTSTKHLAYFQGTEYELNVYKIHGVEKGKTLLIIGGIQGNEPGGYLAADLYVDMSLRKGNLIVVPRANFHSILRNQRGVNGDMNRKFADFSEKDSDNKIVNVLRELIAESDYLLNLHDGSGFYSEKWESDLRNPKRYGQ